MAPNGGALARAGQGRTVKIDAGLIGEFLNFLEQAEGRRGRRWSEMRIGLRNSKCGGDAKFGSMFLTPLCRGVDA